MIKIYEYQYELNKPNNNQKREMQWTSWESYKNTLIKRVQPIENVCYPSVPRNSHFVLEAEDESDGIKMLCGSFYHHNRDAIIRHIAYCRENDNISICPNNKKIKPKNYEQTTCPDCARKEGFSWHTLMRFEGIPEQYKCIKCGRLYFDNEDE